MKSPIGLFARALLAGMSAFVLVSCGGSNDDSNTETTVGAGAPVAQEQRSDAFAATLSVEQETQTGASAETGTGSGTVVIDPETRQMTASLTATGLTTGSAAIHLGQEGEDGPVIVALVETTSGSGIWTASATLSEAQYQALLNGELYFRVQSPSLLNGQFRGQILAQQITAADGAVTGTSSTAGGATASGNTATVESGNDALIVSSEASGFFAALRGENTVPSNSSKARGSAAIVIDSSTRQMVAAVATLGITGTAAQLREAAAGANGPVVISLSETATGSGVWITTSTLSTEQYAALRAGNMYFVVQSAAFPEGEIRGQLLPQRQFFTPVASGANVPPPASGRTPGITTNNTSGSPPTGTGFDVTTGGGVTIPGASTGTGGIASTGGFTGSTGNTGGLGGSSGITGATSFNPVPTGSSTGISSIPNTSTGFDSGLGTTTGTGIGTTSGTGIGSTSNSGLGATTGTGIGTTSGIGTGTGFGAGSGSTLTGTTF